MVCFLIIYSPSWGYESINMDIEKISAFLQKLSTAKVITALLILGAAAFFIYKNFDFITEITFKVDHPKTSAPQTQAYEDRFKWASIEVGTTLIPLQFDIPSYFLVSVKNTGPAIAKHLEVSIDLGRARITSIDIKPKDRCAISSGSAGTADPIRVVCQIVNVGDSVYIYSLLSEPSFRNVVVTSPNLSRPISVLNSGRPPTNHNDITFGDVILFSVEAIVFIGIVIIGWYLLAGLRNLSARIFKGK